MKPVVGAYGNDTWDDHADNLDRLLMLEAVTELKSLKERLDRAELHAGFLDEEADFTVDELLKYKRALEDIADGMDETELLEIGRFAPVVAKAALIKGLK